jgi:hypothetical protein
LAPTEYSIGSAFPIGSMLARNFVLKFRNRAMIDARRVAGNLPAKAWTSSAAD